MDQAGSSKIELQEPNYDIRILVVDDDSMVLEVLVDYLKSFGFKNITSVSDSKKALKYIQDPNMHFDLIISDWEMPDVSGLVILQSVRKNDQKAQTRFIIVTSQQSMERFKISRAAHWHVNAYIVKPFRATVLKEKIWQIMAWSGIENAKKS
jgi:two-component system, chemotaxis family, chemotaxis protein CheY